MASWCRRRASPRSARWCGCAATSWTARSLAPSEAPNVALSIILKVYDGGKLRLARAFRGPQVRLGTGDVELQLSGANVASLHALIELGAQAAVLRASS